MLHDFLTAHRTVLIDRCRAKTASRFASTATAGEPLNGIPRFLDQLVQTLKLEPAGGSSESTLDIGATGALHGRELFDRVCSIERAVRDYGDFCQEVTELAFESGIAISVNEFHTFNRCVDDAMAGAVLEYAKQKTTSKSWGTASNIPGGPIAHELKSHLDTAMLVVAAIKGGNVGMGGATAGLLDRSLMTMRSLIDREIVEARVTSGAPPRLQPIRLAGFLREVEAAAAPDALARECRFSVASVGDDIHINADREMLSAALGNLLHNAFKFTSVRSEVWLRGSASKARVTIEVEDHCGGLSENVYDRLLLPFVHSGQEGSGLGLGLGMFRRSIESTGGVFTVRDVPGSGCIFTIDLPRQALSLASSTVDRTARDGIASPIAFVP